MLCFTTVTSFATPVVENIVTYIDLFAQFQSRGTRAKTRCTAVTVCYQIMVISGIVPTPVTGKAMRFTILCLCEVKSLRSNAPLYGRVLHAVNRKSLIRTPAYRTVVYDDVLSIHTAKTVHIIRRITRTETHEAYNNIISGNGKGLIRYTDSTR